MALPTPPTPDQPIPNNPFYSPETWYIRGPYSPLIVGTNLSVSSDGVISSSGGGGGGVTSVLAGVGITVSGATGNVTISNAGVLSLTAGAGIALTGNTGVITITSLATGTVTAISTTGGISGGPITTTGTLSLTNTGVTAATYINPTITVDAKGRITSASSGTAIASVTGTAPIAITAGLNPVVSIAAASTATSGAVLLSNSTTSNSSATAATSLAVKTAFDAATAAIPKSCLTTKGALITATSPSLPVALPPGADNEVLIACAACPTGLAWFSPTYCTGSVTSITAGTGLTGGVITTVGTIALDTTCVVSPNLYLSKGSILSATAPGTPANFASGVDGQVLTACAACAEGLTWFTPTYCPGTVTSLTAGTGLTGGTVTSTGTFALDTACVIAPTIFPAKGAILSATAASTPTALSVGTDGQVLTACAACTEGLTWCTPVVNPGTVTSITAGTGLLGGTVTSAGTFTLDTTCVIAPTALTSKGALITATAPSTVTALPPGTDNQLLVACSACAEGLTWATNPFFPYTTPNYGSFYDTTTQINALTTSYNTVSLNSVAYSNNFSVVAGTRITAAVAGIYNLQLSLQVRKTDAGTDTFEFWFAKNGTDIPNSNTSIKTHSNDEAVIASLNFVESMSAGDFLEIRWYSADTFMQLLAVPAQAAVPGVSPARPAIPSAIVTVVPVGA